MWTALKVLLSPYRFYFYGAAAVAFAAYSTFLFYKGYEYNESVHRAASEKFKAEFNKAQLDDLFKVANESASATEDYQKTEALNDTIEAGLLRPLTPDDGCIDAGWLRNLDKLH